MPSFFDRIKTTIRNIIGSFTEIEKAEPGIPDWEDFIDDSIDDTKDIIMSYLEAEQPYGKEEPRITFYNKFGKPVYDRKKQYPSRRTGHTPISEGWEIESDRSGNTIRIVFGNISEHIRPVIGPSEKDSWTIIGPVIFWWGRPLPWIPTPPAQEGPQWFPWVTREAPELNPFHRRAMDRASMEVYGSIFEGVGDYLVEVLQRSGYRRR